jgi:predicted HAD superfamily Cof-like phosphohydrolase
MIIDELSEFMVTRVPNYKEKMIEMINESRDLVIDLSSMNDSDSICAEQGDALVDMYYYSLNAAAKKGIDLSKIFNHVHEANMNKRDKTTGKFIKRSDGKILKPDNWQAPDILSLIKQMKLNE